MAAGKEAYRLHCDAPLAETAQKMLEARLDELTRTRATISGPADSEALHELRIAAKRLRYSLEMFSVCLPSNLAQERADGVRVMQDVLGRIHDLDVLHVLLREQITAIEVEAREDALRIAMAPAEEDHRDDQLLDRSRADGKADGRLGLYRVIAAKADQRRQLYDRFVELWTQWEETGFLTAIRSSLSRTGAGAGEAAGAT